jgi:hypothetical protein
MFLSCETVDKDLQLEQKKEEEKNLERNNNKV